MSEGQSQEEAPKEQAPKEQAPGIDPKRLTRSKAYLHRHLALDRTDFNAIDSWKSLSGSIAAVLNVPSIHNATWDSLDEALQQKFISYAPNAEELFETYGMNQRIFQRWVWEIVDENFFSHKSKDIVWASPYWEAQATIERYLRDQPNPTDHDFRYDRNLESHKFPHWRYTTIDFYMSLEDTPHSVRRIDPTCVVPIIAKALGRYFPEEYDGRDHPVLRNLASSVVDLDFLFDANLTVFSHVFHHPITQQTSGFSFQRNLEGIERQAMEDHYGGLGRNEEGQNVDLVVNPMLLQRGNYYGYDYGVKTAAHLMQVCVAWLEAHRNPPDSPEVDGEEEHTAGTDEVTAEERSEGHGDHGSEDEDNKEQGDQVEGLPKEEEEKSREEVDKDEDNEAITNQGEKNNKNKERAGKKGDESEEEEDQTKQKEKKINPKNTTKSKKVKNNKQKRRQQ
ncbi:hypothetical protein FNAPI_7075 [Fusarium napiforme]|uniref:Uncharacterized protein n=1 Tax=Fusarium napiforme TaxID=42672 RepID=A0A8H5N3S3_9HYPO|nr:hypothetical protein FNAPI_7075 [Fusarium napiforme]